MKTEALAIRLVYVVNRLCCSLTLTFRLFRGLPRCTFLEDFLSTILYAFIISPVHDA